MRDRRAIMIATILGGSALAANIAAAAIAVSVTSPPAAAAFAIAGIAAALTSLIVAIVWALHDRTSVTQADATTSTAPRPTGSEGRVIYLDEWLKTRGAARGRANPLSA